MKTAIIVVLSFIITTSAMAKDKCVDRAHDKCIYAVNMPAKSIKVIDANGNPKTIIEPAYVGYFYKLTRREKERLAGECEYKPYGRYGALPETCRD
ncbi:MAG: hypothetical protein Q7S17_05725, partial [Xanthobacteraceae bacterium]|nr:hypothetical protein [Xanthobacteraceae bacterium]